MGTQVTIGGERLGSGNRMKANLHGYERSSHDLSYIWRSTMAAGTLVPFLTEVALPGDTFDIDLQCEILTHPTIGPLFGSYKIQLDVFQIPIRLYQGLLHMNMLDIGRDMSRVQLPQLFMQANPIVPSQTIDGQQINPSSIFSYLGINGLGYDATNPLSPVFRGFNAIPYLAYWDIYKNYYANKQEEVGAMIHKDMSPTAVALQTCEIVLALPPITIDPNALPPYTYAFTNCIPETRMVITATGLTENFDPSQLLFYLQFDDTGAGAGGEWTAQGSDLFDIWEVFPESNTIIATKPKPIIMTNMGWADVSVVNGNIPENYDAEPEIVFFPLNNIDQMRRQLLQYDWLTSGEPFLIGSTTAAPYGLPFEQDTTNPTVYSKQFAQEGLALKTYNSDLFNNWISTEWIDGADGISEITKIDTSGGSFTIDELNLSKKIYDMLNRIAISGGTYDDWLEVTYDEKRIRSSENPMYIGGLIKNLIFQEVVSNSAAISEGDRQPLGTLAGRGTTGSKHKGGHIIAKVDEPSYIMGIVSLTPIIDYSQGNKWDTNLRNMNDFHKPALDQIGFQDLITDQMAWFDTKTDPGTGGVPTNIYKSAGKQPAWINYMTNVNVVKGNFAIQNQQMFMVLNRRYKAFFDTPNTTSIADLTTYIDPVKFNHIFADTRRDAQNFWTQIAVNMTARRKMSAKIMPNL